MNARSLVALAALSCGQEPGPGRPPGVTADGGLVEVLHITDLTAPGGPVVVQFVDGTSLDGAQAWVDGEPLEPVGIAGDLVVWELARDATASDAELTVQLLGGAAGSYPLVIAEPVFRRVEDQVGLDFTHEVAGWQGACAEALTGLGFADIDGDGDLDFLTGNLMGDSVLWRNDGDADGDGLPAFVDATTGSGLEGLDLVASIHFADFDNDGDPDLFVGRRGRNRLYRNLAAQDGAATFEDQTELLGIGDAEQRTMGAGWGDYDGDGDLDLYVTNHAWCFPSSEPGVDHRTPDEMYRNDGPDGFTDVTRAMPDGSGEMSSRFGFTAIWADFDRDADQDLLVINDQVPTGGRIALLANETTSQSDPSFTNVTQATGIAPAPDALGKAVNAMGADIGDLNHDGLPDVAYSNIGPNFLMVSSQDATGAITYTAQAARGGSARTFTPWQTTSITWATHILDFDNDADLDLIYIGGELKKGPTPQPHAFFENQGDLTFVERTWDGGLASVLHGKASAVVDLDGDGFLELVVANWAGPLEVYHNDLPAQGNRNHWVVVDAVGDGIHVNRDGLGAIVELTPTQGPTQTCFRTPRPSLSATGDPGCHFGLGESEGVAELVVVWPEGTRQAVALDGVDRRVSVTYTAPP